LFPVTGKRPLENFSGKWEKLARLLRQDDQASAYQVSVGVFSAGEVARILGRDQAVRPPEVFEEHLPRGFKGRLDIRSMMNLDLQTFLVEDVLTKVDRASMSTGLEVRVPILDHRLVSLARSMEVPDLFENRRGKAPLRRLARRSLPAHLVDRPKMGFTLPIDAWFRGELRGYLQDNLLDPGSPLGDIADHSFVRRIVDDHLAGRGNFQEKLYNLLTLNTWMRTWTGAA
jgi:asparagine synthase (glutamine-hydrolysing)